MIAPTPLTAEEYLDHLIATAIYGCVITHHHLEILKKLIDEGKTGVYTA